MNHLVSNSPFFSNSYNFGAFRLIKESIYSGRLQVFIAIIFLFGSPFASAQDLQWVKQIRGLESIYATGIAVDIDGNVYTVGRFEESADFDPSDETNFISSLGFEDMFIAKFDPAGELIWADRFGGTGTVLGTSIAVDDDANIYVTGAFQDTIIFNPPGSTPTLISAGGQDIIVMKLNTDGDVYWAKSLGGLSYELGADIVVDQEGNVITTGRFSGSGDFDPGAGVFTLESEGIDDIFISKLDPDGNFVWAKAMIGTQTNLGRGVDVDNSGNIYTTGQFSGTADFDPSDETFELNSASSSAVYVSKLSAEGNLVWAKQFAGNGSRGLDIAVDDETNIYTTGSFWGLQDFDPGANQALLNSEGSSDVFVSKLDGDGNYLWAKKFGGSASDLGLSIFTDASGVHTTGGFRNEAIFDFDAEEDVTLISAGSRDIFVSKLSSAGNLIWAAQMGGPESDEGTDIFIDGDGVVYTIGVFQETADFDPGSGTANLTSLGNQDTFISKLNQVTGTRNYNNFDKKITFQPNPAKDYSILSWDQKLQINYLEVFDLHGKLLFAETFTQRPYQMNLQGLNSGIYIVKVSDRNSNRGFMGKLVVLD